MTVLSKPANSEINNFFVEGEHRGLDYGWGQGKQIYAAADGVVESVYDGGPNAWGNGWGNRVVIRHNARSATTYNHIQSGTISVSPGQSVSRGQQIATMGETGLTFGVHLHFELYVDGVRVDPLPYFSADLPGSDGSGSGGVPAPGDWVIGTTLYQGAVGQINLDAGATVYAAGPGDSEYGIAEKYSISWEQLKAWTEALASSKWGPQILAAQQSYHIFGDTVYQGQIFAVNDVVSILNANEAAQIAAQEAAVNASIVAVPEATDLVESNKGVFDSKVAARQLAIKVDESTVGTTSDTVETVVEELPQPPREIRRMREPVDAKTVSNVNNFIAQAASNIVFPAWFRKYVLWPIILVWGVILIAIGQWFQGIGELPPIEYGGWVNVTMVILPVLAVVASANTGQTEKQAKKDKPQSK